MSEIDEKIDKWIRDAAVCFGNAVTKSNTELLETNLTYYNDTVVLNIKQIKQTVLAEIEKKIQRQVGRGHKVYEMVDISDIRKLLGGKDEKER